MQEKIIFDFFWERGTTSCLWHLYVHKDNIIFPCISSERSSFNFRPKKKDHLLAKKIPSFIQERSYFSAFFWKDYLFRISEQNMIFPFIFWEISSFIFCQRRKIISSGKINIIFASNTRKITFHRHLFAKINFLERLKN